MRIDKKHLPFVKGTTVKFKNKWDKWEFGIVQWADVNYDSVNNELIVWYVIKLGNKLINKREHELFKKNK